MGPLRAIFEIIDSLLSGPRKRKRIKPLKIVGLVPRIVPAELRFQTATLIGPKPGWLGLVIAHGLQEYSWQLFFTQKNFLVGPSSEIVLDENHPILNEGSGPYYCSRRWVIAPSPAFFPHRNFFVSLGSSIERNPKTLAQLLNAARFAQWAKAYPDPYKAETTGQRWVADRDRWQPLLTGELQSVAIPSSVTDRQVEVFWSRAAWLAWAGECLRKHAGVTPPDGWIAYCGSWLVQVSTKSGEAGKTMSPTPAKISGNEVRRVLRRIMFEFPSIDSGRWIASKASGQRFALIEFSPAMGTLSPPDVSTGFKTWAKLLDANDRHDTDVMLDRAMRNALMAQAAVNILTSLVTGGAGLAASVQGVSQSLMDGVRRIADQIEPEDINEIVTGLLSTLVRVAVDYVGSPGGNYDWGRALDIAGEATEGEFSSEQLRSSLENQIETLNESWGYSEDLLGSLTTVPALSKLAGLS
jgi:hypothetical protein